MSNDGMVTKRRHWRGCNCKKSNCLKNYCECYEAKVPCGRSCKCKDCHNNIIVRQSLDSETNQLAGPRARRKSRDRQASQEQPPSVGSFWSDDPMASEEDATASRLLQPPMEKGATEPLISEDIVASVTECMLLAGQKAWDSYAAGARSNDSKHIRKPTIFSYYDNLGHDTADNDMEKEAAVQAAIIKEFGTCMEQIVTRFSSPAGDPSHGPGAKTGFMPIPTLPTLFNHAR